MFSDETREVWRQLALASPDLPNFENCGDAKDWLLKLERDLEQQSRELDSARLDVAGCELNIRALNGKRERVLKIIEEFESQPKPATLSASEYDFVAQKLALEFEKQYYDSGERVLRSSYAGLSHYLRVAEHKRVPVTQSSVFENLPVLMQLIQHHSGAPRRRQ
jgi:hypothetical protein